MQKLKVFIKNDQKEVVIPSGTKLLIRRSCHAVLEHEQFPYSAEVSVSLISNEEIRKLNEQYRGKDADTDVLSFPLGENGEYEFNGETQAAILGDIVISVEKAAEQAKLYGHSFRREIAFLTVHSMLHLLGYDHETDPLEKAQMREKEEIILTKLGIPRELSYEDVAR